MKVDRHPTHHRIDGSARAPRTSPTTYSGSTDGCAREPVGAGNSSPTSDTGTITISSSNPPSDELDGVHIDSLSITTNLGTTAVGRVQIGDVQTGRTHNVGYDDVAFGTQRVGP